MTFIRPTSYMSICKWDTTPRGLPQHIELYYVKDNPPCSLFADVREDNNVNTIHKIVCRELFPAVANLGVADATTVNNLRERIQTMGAVIEGDVLVLSEGRTGSPNTACPPGGNAAADGLPVSGIDQRTEAVEQWAKKINVYMHGSAAENPRNRTRNRRNSEGQTRSESDRSKTPITNATRIVGMLYRLNNYEFHKKQGARFATIALGALSGLLTLIMLENVQCSNATMTDFKRHNGITTGSQLLATLAACSGLFFTLFRSPVKIMNDRDLYQEIQIFGESEPYLNNNPQVEILTKKFNQTSPFIGNNFSYGVQIQETEETNLLSSRKQNSLRNCPRSSFSGLLQQGKDLLVEEVKILNDVLHKKIEVRGREGGADITLTELKALTEKTIDKLDTIDRLPTTQKVIAFFLFVIGISNGVLSELHIRDIQSCLKDPISYQRQDSLVTATALSGVVTLVSFFALHRYPQIRLQD